MRNLWIWAIVLPVVWLGAASRVNADVFSFTLDTNNLGGPPGPYVEVDVNRIDSTHATITFTSLVNSGDIFLMGGQGAVAVNVHAASWTIGSFTDTNVPGFTPGPLSDGGAANEDGFGSFNQTVDSFDGYTHSSSIISFALTNTSGTWLSASDVLIGNSQGQFAAAHIFVAAFPQDASAGAIATGYATGHGTVPPPPPPPPPGVPEPATMLLAGLGAIGLAGYRLRRRKLSS